jgi:hypothetical protein
LAIAAVVIFGILAVVLAAANAMGVIVPGWAVHILWILLVVFVAVLAIRLLADLWNKGGP